MFKNLHYFYFEVYSTASKMVRPIPTHASIANVGGAS